MTEQNHFTVQQMSVTVTASPEALTYTFTPPAAGPRPRLSLLTLGVFVVVPLCLLAGVISAGVVNPVAEPRWSLLLSGTCLVQALIWLTVGAIIVVEIVRLGQANVVLRFTPTAVWHQHHRVCRLSELRGLRLWHYHATTGPRAGQREAYLSLLIGDTEQTHGLFGRFDEPQLLYLADDMHRRLTAFGFHQGLMPALEPLSIVACTEAEAVQQMNTRPPHSISRSYAQRCLNLVGQPVTGTLWCLLMFAGLFASGQRMMDAELSHGWLLAHVVSGFLHVILLLGIWSSKRSATTTQVPAPHQPPTATRPSVS
ncbi:MAG: hypothetical protein RMJ56_17790 [Gemmataceae bacterium]|nr:hypothetical protein [Gemmata sp.]MDW8199451.1 hypothetical protein [Gemmataceae bacterium]